MRKMSGLALYWRYLRVHALSTIQYKGWFITAFYMFALTIGEPLMTMLLFSRFGGIGEWTVERILLMYGTGIACYGLADVFFQGFAKFPWRMVQNGGFDRLLLRPRSTVLQVAVSFFDFPRVARPASGLFVAGWALGRLGIPLGPPQILLILYALMGGVVLYAGVFVLTSGIAFFSIKGLDWIHILGVAGYEVTRCPVPYLPRALYGMFTFVVPLLVVVYYPASVLCGWGEPAWTALLALPAGAAFLLIALVMWRVGMGRYASTGS